MNDYDKLTQLGERISVLEQAIEEITLIHKAQGQRLNDLRIAMRKQNEINKGTQEVINSVRARISYLKE